MTAKIIQFTPRPNSNFIPMPADAADLVPILSRVFVEHCEMFGWPENTFYGEHIWAFTDNRYPQRLLLDIDTPNHARGLFCLDNDYKLVQILDQPLAHCR